MMNKKLLTLLLALLGFGVYSQVGFNCQYVPGVQFGFVNIKSNNSKIGNHKQAAGMAIFMIDRFKTKWYTNLEMNGLYYGVTQYNKSHRSKADSTKVAKTEGGMFAGRIGYGFGKSEDFRVGPNLNIGYSMSNLQAASKSFEVAKYWNFGGGIFVYKKINGKIRTMAKIGFEKYYNKKTDNFVGAITGKGFYLEGTVSYNFYQKYGVAVMPAFYSKKFSYTYNGEATPTETKVKSFVLRIGFTKFF